MAGGVLCVLFTDLAGSPELMTRLGDAVFDRLRSEHFASLREAVAAAGGVEVKNTGDGLLATFTSAVIWPERAAATGRLGRHPGELVRLLPELAELVPGLPEPLRSDPETERYRLFEALAAWLADMSSETPVLATDLGLVNVERRARALME